VTYCLGIIIIIIIIIIINICTCKFFPSRARFIIGLRAVKFARI
jgi:hypothetical protein